MNTYKILQIKDMQNSKYLFRGYNYAKHNKFTIDDYKVVYEGELNTIGKCIDEILEELFFIFNINKPKDFKGHSLSISDVVELNGKYYYVDELGFVKIK